MANQSLLRISREIHNIQKNTDLSIAVAARDSDLRNVKTLIIGPPDTPYEFGFFEFSINFPNDYPDSPPKVEATTTNGGRCRFNPNIYSQGKVCLSILGTWRGERGEMWSSAQGLESILISIQSLLSPNPYENEPGFEHSVGPHDKKAREEYVEKIRHETLRISVIQRMEGYLGIYADGTITPKDTVEQTMSAEAEAKRELDDSAARHDTFKDLCKRRFLWYYESYLNAIHAAAKRHKPNEPFKLTCFEAPSNGMEGKFDYGELSRRLLVVKQVLDAETTRWAEEGLVLVRREHHSAASVQRMFRDVVERYSKDDAVTLDIELENKNPFVWILTYFGRPMTQLDGGMFRIRMAIAPRFPEEQPRVRFETPLFHHRIATDGTLCYFVDKSDELRDHVRGIVDAVQEEHPAYDPRTLVNLEASKLFWGRGPEDKKLYNRQLRRTVQKSVEE